MTSKLKFLPLLVFIMFPASFLTTYSIGVANGHIRPFFSYISDTGAIHPESCWFSLFLNLTGVVLGIIVYIRYKQVEEFFRGNDSVWLPRINLMGLVMGFISALGASVVGSFQETRVFTLHVLGAFMAFLGGSIYFCFQSYFTFKMLPMFTNKCVAILRTLIGIVCIFLFASVYTCGVFAVQQFKGDNIVYWEPHDGGWTLRTISVTCEWIMASLFDLYLLSFMLDFSRIQYKSPKFKLVDLTQSKRSSDSKFNAVHYNPTDV